MSSQNSPTSSLPPQLVEQFGRGNGVVFVGAGLSVGAGLPGWGGLIQQLRKRVADCPLDARFTDVAQFFINEHGAHFLIEQIRHSLEKVECAPTSVHDLLPLLPVREFFTTNYDRLLENTFHRVGLGCVRIVRDEDLPSLDSLDRQVIKIHGDLDQPDTIVVATQHYDAYLADRPALADFLKVRLQTRTALFLGYGFGDDDLRAVLHRVSREVKWMRRNLFAVMFDPTPVVIRELARQGITVIPIAEGRNQTESIRSWLESFIEELRRGQTVDLDGRSRSINNNLPLRPKLQDLVGRAEVIDRVWEGLRSQSPSVTIWGAPGVGKSSLAVAVGHAASSQNSIPPPGAVTFRHVVWIKLRDVGSDQEWFDSAFTIILSTTSDRSMALWDSIEHKHQVVQSILSQSATLIIIDQTDGATKSILKWIDSVPMPSKVLLTAQVVGNLRRTWPVELRGLRANEAATFIRLESARQSLSVEIVNELVASDLAEVTGRNPQAIKLSVGLAHDGRVPVGEMCSHLRDHGGDIFDELFLTSWDRLSGSARSIMFAASQFAPGVSIDTKALVSVSHVEGGTNGFAVAISECEKYALIEAHRDENVIGGEITRHIIHPLTRGFVQRQLLAVDGLLGVVWGRLAFYYRDYISTHIIRDAPAVPYWSGLVGKGMDEIDAEWPTIESVLNWAETHDRAVFVDCVMTLVHYLDSRFLNQERLVMVEKAADAARDLGRKLDEAWLRVDALSWTLVEEGRLEDAHRQIARGMDLAQALDVRGDDEPSADDVGERIERMSSEQPSVADDIRMLATAWRARVISMSDTEEALGHILSVLKMPCSKWVRVRVYMALGDINMAQQRYDDALQVYQSAKELTLEYGGEGEGYQLLPRIGLAHCGSGNLAAAEECFETLSRNHTIIIGGFYSEYGLALVRYLRDDLEVAWNTLNDLRGRIAKKSSANMLLTMLDELRVKCEAVRRPKLREVLGVGANITRTNTRVVRYGAVDQEGAETREGIGERQTDDSDNS